MTPGTLILIVIVAVVCAFIADAIGRRKGHGYGFPLGLLLGIIGVAIMAFMPVSQEGLVQREEARLRAQEEAQRRLDAERDREYKP